MHKCKNCDEFIIKEFEICYECNKKVESSEEINEDEFQSINKISSTKTNQLLSSALHSILLITTSIFSIFHFNFLEKSSNASIYIGTPDYKDILEFMIFCYFIYNTRKNKLRNILLLLIPLIYFIF